MQACQTTYSVPASRHRERVTVERLENGYVRLHGKRLLSFSDNDYLGLSVHPQVVRAAGEALQREGAGAKASRLVTGNLPLYDALEAKLKAFKKSQDALVFGSGYLANLGVLGSLPTEKDLVLADKKIHASMLDGIRQSGATLQRFLHNQPEDAARKLAEQRHKYEYCYIATESVFSMDGDRAPLEALLQLARRYDATLVVDDAHGLGVIEQGRGAFGSENTLPEHVILVGTFSKAAGSYGGYVCASSAIIDALVNHARSLIYTTALPPAVLAANLAALEIIEQNPDMCALPLARAQQFTKALGLPEAQSAIVPLIIGEDADALAASQALEAVGYLVKAIRPPTVAPGTARLRFAFSALHTAGQIEHLAAVIRHQQGFAPCA